MISTRVALSDLPEYLLVIGHSGSMLAEAAVAAGIKPLVVDMFADIDTRSLASKVYKIAELTPEYIEYAIDELMQLYPVKHAVYGSGFEDCPEALKLVHDRLQVFGNEGPVFAQVQNKKGFFSALTDMAIPFPETVFDAPKLIDDWLQKPFRGQGGQGIVRCRTQPCRRTHVYWQRFLPGKAYSVLFLANGSEARIVGFNTQWPLSEAGDREFLFSGIVNRCDLDNEEKSIVVDWVHRCVSTFGLKGLNSLDFMKSGGCCYALEINARLPASLPLYDGMLEGHIFASQGQWLDVGYDTGNCAGVQIVYAEADLMIPYGFVWPEGARNRPDCGFVCRKGEPVCSIIAHHGDERQVLQELEQIRQQIILNVIKV